MKTSVIKVYCIPIHMKMWKNRVQVYTVGIENSLRKILQHNLVFKEHPKLYQNYYFITDLLIFTSLTRHIQWIMICLLKLSGVGQSLLLLHALIAFRFILNKSWDRQKCVSILGMDFVKCFMLLFSNMDKNCLKSDVTNVFLYPFSLVVSLHAST